MSSDLNVNHETGEVVQQGRSPRFTLWIAFLVFSTITLGASVEVKNEQNDNANSAAKWAVACSAITFSVTGLVVVVHLSAVLSTMFVGTVIEGILTLILAGFWAATVSIVTNASNGLSVNDSDTNQVQNGNLYYFSWAGFVTSIIILVSYLRSAYGVDVVGAVQTRGARLTLWAATIASAMVVMGSAARVFENECQELDDAIDKHEYCARTKLAISVGAIGFLLSDVVVAFKLLSSTPPFLIEFIVAVLLAILDAVGVAYTTSSAGPGSAIGNLYYFAWASFLCTACLAADCFNQFTGGNAGPSGSNNGDSSTPTSKGDHTESSDIPGDLELAESDRI